ncbi:cellulase family glycosylhydrolase [Geofilum rubicundum]|uniref:Beta-1,4-mannanase n=1 Tax=Geofilum rubicundum JCM 15548 TaxID=1236989 RepID=A0A0E9M276_9BACT|nr:cellulase family glycosylhydrolase [Geofilum rubicundum]GAO31698.1 beta-1,4-mannanase [Geofilum rubicundum JCM 15548]
MHTYFLTLFLSAFLLTGCYNTREPQHNTIYVDGKNIFDASGAPLIMRGVNEMFIWSDDFLGDTIIPEIAKTGANALRIVWLTEASNAKASPENLDLILQNTINSGLFPMPELHDATGKWDKLDSLVDYWTRPDVVEVLKKHEEYLLLNIANECGGHEIKSDQFLQGYKKAIDRLRAVGLQCPLVIDASGWGQDLDILLETGPELLQHDPEHNLIFSVHMWWPAEDGSKQRIIHGIEQSVALNLPLIVGEFAPMGVGCARSIDHITIMEQCQKHEMGWLAWSWGAVGNGDCEEMDMTRGDRRGTFEGLTDWGLEVSINHPLSIQNTSIRSGYLKSKIK